MDSHFRGNDGERCVICLVLFLYTVIVMFFTGMILANAGNARISLYILPWHVAWHELGAFGFITFWAFNHIRFTEMEHVRSASR